MRKPITLADQILRYRSFGRRPALVHRGRYRTRTWSYEELYQATVRNATRLADAGIQPGDRVLLRGPNTPEWAAAFLGCVYRGAVVVPLEATSPDALAAKVAKQSGAVAALLPRDDPWGTDLRRLALEDLDGVGPAPPLHRAAPEEMLEIVYTSGSTGEPRGVVLTHGNILAYLGPIEKGFLQRRKWAAPLLPVRFLSLPPLSHLYGQAVGIFLPLLMESTGVFVEGFDAWTLRRTIREERIWLAMVVPRVLAMLARSVRSDAERRGWDLDSLSRSGARKGLARRIWRARRVHRMLGWRLRAFVVGGAPLDPELEQFWRGLGYLIIQGYGMTEAAPLVTLADPFRGEVGFVGKPMPGQELRLADDGEILVRGGNVMAGYLDDPEATRRVLDEDGWLHTGDLGELGPQGALRIIGRKKEMLVTAEGLNVYPEDVELVLRRLEGIRDAVVLGRRARGGAGDQVHAVLLLEEDASEAQDLVSRANRELEPHQRIRDVTVWEGTDFPRSGTLKVRRRAVAAAVGTGTTPEESAPEPADRLAAVLEQLGVKPGASRDDANLEELGLSSLDLVELAASLEEEFGVPVPDEGVSADVSVGQLRQLVSQEGPSHTGQVRSMSPPRWSRSLLARWTRNAFNEAVFLPAMSLWVRLQVEGREHLERAPRPALLVPNHVSLFDVPVLRRALRRPWRTTLAPAMRADMFDAWMRPGEHSRAATLSQGLQVMLAGLMYQAYLLPRGQGFRTSLEYTGELLDAGYCPVLFPEGERSSGDMRPFEPGIGLLAVRLGATLIPVHTRGLERVLPLEASWPRRGPVVVRFGAHRTFSTSDDPGEATAWIETAVRSLAAF